MNGVNYYLAVSTFKFVYHHCIGEFMRYLMALGPAKGPKCIWQYPFPILSLDVMPAGDSGLQCGIHGKYFINSRAQKLAKFFFHNLTCGKTERK